MVATAEHGLIIGLVIGIAIALIRIDMVCHHARNLWQHGGIAERMVQVSRVSAIDVGITTIGVEGAVKINHTSFAQDSDGVFHGVGIEVTHDQQVVVFVERTVFRVVLQQTLRLSFAVSIVGALSIALIGRLQES